MTDSPPTQPAKGLFDPRAFLGRAGAGKAIEKYARNDKIFSQGDVADTVFFIQKGKVKVTVLSEQWQGGGGRDFLGRTVF
jgi:CRP/FNR family transcriptional regulator, cyclic AMP receptor protein